MSPFEAFFKDIDASWDQSEVTLQLIGAAALMLQTPYSRATRDGDVLQTAFLPTEAKDRLLALAGPRSALSTLHRLYLDIVPNGLPFMPHGPKFNPHHALNGTLTHLRIETLDVVDVVVSKFARFHANDRSDIAAMIQGGHVDHARVIDRFQRAVDAWSMDARSDELPKIVERLHQVERDAYGLPPTSIALPDWV